MDWLTSSFTATSVTDMPNLWTAQYAKTMRAFTQSDCLLYTITTRLLPGGLSVTVKQATDLVNNLGKSSFNRCISKYIPVGVARKTGHQTGRMGALDAAFTWRPPGSAAAGPNRGRRFGRSAAPLATTRPAASRVTTLSAPRRVDMRWLITRVVLPAMSALTVSFNRLSTEASRKAVA